MSDSQLLSLSESSKRDSSNSVVESYVEVSPEAASAIQSTVQVTLAKRILLAGTNRVLCLGASTSVPINEDERASVSDLALRLSDGTNVALSLSFFNENLGNVFPCTPTALTNAPLGRVTFEPLRYAAKDESRLGMVLVFMAFAAVLAVYFTMPGAFNKLIHANTSNKYTTAGVDNSAKKVTVARPALAHIVTVSVPPKSTVSESGKVSKSAATALQPFAAAKLEAASKSTRSVAAFKVRQAKNGVKKATGSPAGKRVAQPGCVNNSAKVKTGETHFVKNLSSAKSKSMFIPPPPPTEYSIPPANSPFWQLYTPPGSVPAEQVKTKPASASTPVSGKGTPVSGTGTPVKATLVGGKSTPVGDKGTLRSGSGAAGGGQGTQFGSNASPPIVKDELPGKAKPASPQHSKDSFSSDLSEKQMPHLLGTSANVLEHKETLVPPSGSQSMSPPGTTRGATDAGAPLPGDNSENLHLERIVPPGQ